VADEEKRATFSPPDTKSWLEYSWKIQQEAPNRFEDAAKFLVMIISVVMTIFVTGLDKLKLITEYHLLLAIIFLFWFIALLFSFMVLFPHKYTFPSKSTERIKEMQFNIVKRKKIYFHISAFSFIVPFIIFTVLIFLATIN